MVSAFAQYLVDVRDVLYDFGRMVADYLHFFFNNVFFVLLIITCVASFIYVLAAIYSLLKKRRVISTHNYADSKLPHVTIQIPTFNELAAINCAKRCLDFDYPATKFDIIIGDDSNDPLISKQIDAFAKKHDSVNVTRRGLNVGFKPGNLNHMLQYTRGEMIAIFDSDFLPETDFLRRMVSPLLADKNLVGVQSRWKVANPKQNIVTALGTGITNSFHYVILPLMLAFSNSIVFCGSGEIVRKKYLLEAGGWKSGVLTEDIDFSIRSLARGHTIAYLRDVECYCEVPQTVMDLFKQQKRWAYGVIRSLIENRRVLSSANKRVRGFIPMITLFVSGYIFTTLIFVLSLVGLLSLITHPPQAIIFSQLFGETFRNILLTAGLTVVTVTGVFLARNTDTNIFKLLFGTYTIGLVLILYVMQGVYLAIVNQPMRWYMLKKNGNER